MSRNTYRLSSGGARIDRTKPLSFHFDGRRLWGFHGDTLASALLANGVTLVGRSFKLHRPRGITGLAGEDTGGFVQIFDGARSTPNIRATQTELIEGLVARSVNCWPSARWDLAGGLALLSRFLPAGFYYKTFKWPNWHWYEPLIRHLAGLGRAPEGVDPDGYQREYLHCDVLVIGGGSAGVAAVAAAAARGADVIVVEEDRIAPTGKESDPCLSSCNVRILEWACAFGYYEDNLVAVCQRGGRGRIAQRLFLIRAQEVVLATGAIEQPMIFPGNDRPGVMLSSAVLGYLERYAVVPGRRPVFVTNNDQAYHTAVQLQRAGARVAAIIDSRNTPGSAAREAMAAEIPVYTGSSIICTAGWHALRSIAVGRHGESRSRHITCDLLCTSGGWAPTLHLYSQSGGKLTFDEELRAFVPGEAMRCVRVVGSAQGTSLPRLGGNAWLGEVGKWSERAQRHAFVDLMSDVAVSDIVIAAREGYLSPEHLKRYTTIGMSPDQGKTSNLNAHAILGAITGRSAAAIGTTKYRPPYTAVTLGVFAGRSRGALFSKVRRLSTHVIQAENGARMMELSGWLRPVHYAANGSLGPTVTEVLAVRNRVGIMDYSPIGKIEVSGRDAALFLERVYAVPVASLSVGRARYGIMLNENGVIIDDGIVARLSERCFFLTVTSGHAEMILDWLEEWHQCAWPELDVLITPLTTHCAALLVSGPHARALLSALKPGLPLDASRFPHMSVREGSLGGVPVRMLRTGFSGELSFEIYLPWRQAVALWQQLRSAGAAFELAPFGTDAMLMLRLEKGFIHVGIDTDSTSVPDAVDMARSQQKKSEAFIGMQALVRFHSQTTERHQLVGFEPVGSDNSLPEGAQIPCLQGTGRQGSVTSSGVSPTLSRPIAIGLLQNGRARYGEIVPVHHNGRRSRARVRAPCFYDPKSERLRDAS